MPPMARTLTISRLQLALGWRQRLGGQCVEQAAAGGGEARLQPVAQRHHLGPANSGCFASGSLPPRSGTARNQTERGNAGPFRYEPATAARIERDHRVVVVERLVLYIYRRSFLKPPTRRTRYGIVHCGVSASSHISAHKSATRRPRFIATSSIVRHPGFSLSKVSSRARTAA